MPAQYTYYDYGEGDEENNEKSENDGDFANDNNQENTMTKPQP